MNPAFLSPRRRLAARIREAHAALQAGRPLHADGPARPEPASGMSSSEYAHALLAYNAYAVGALGMLALAAADELEARP